MELAERFMNYTKFDTQSNEESERVPSTAKPLDFARYLKRGPPSVLFRIMTRVLMPVART